MSLILNIETATRVCSVGLSDGSRLLSLRESDEKNIHAARITVFIDEVLKEAGKEMNMLNAVAVSMGPGSYTGLRIGVSTAKGLGYALGIPLIAVPTLQSMALGVALDHEVDVLFCPMIDARRMEVYTALYDRNNREMKATEALIVDEDAFEEELRGKKILYFGDGAEKCREVLDAKGMVYIPEIYPSARHLAIIAAGKFKAEAFEDIAYFEPYYLKDFIAGKAKVKGLK